MGSVTFRNIMNGVGFGTLPAEVSIDEIAKERGVFSAHPEWVIANGTPLAKRATAAAFDLWRHVNRDDAHPVVDIRVQRLMPGMFPSIPGWHCDGIDRDGYAAQPDLTKIVPERRHFVATISTRQDRVSNTEFLYRPMTIRVDPTRVWASAHEHIEAHVHQSVLARDGDLYEFSQDCLHRATATIDRGWRMFFRLSAMSRPAIGNRFSDAEQVYILTESNGW